MTLLDRSFMGAETQDTQAIPCIARAITAELSKRYPHHTAKYVARDLGCTPKAAANLLDGHLSTASLGRLVAAYGAGWLAERVLEAAGETLEAYIDHQAAEAERAAVRAKERAGEVRRLHAKIQAARGSDAGSNGARA